VTACIALRRGMAFATALVFGTALAAAPQVEYHKTGDVGVFAATLALPADVDLGASVLTVQPRDDKTYLLYVDLPLSALDRVKGVNRYEQPRLKPQARRPGQRVAPRVPERWWMNGRLA